jgi:diacylglycerol kinase family enzyme
MLNALLVGNPHSGAGHKLPRADLPGRWLEDPAAVGPDDLGGVDVLALFGGDGTMQLTLSQLLRQVAPTALPPIAILPFGTTNMNAGNLNRARSRSAAAASLARMLEAGQLDCRERCLVRVSGAAAEQYGFFFGIGVIADVVARWSDERKPGATTNQLRSAWAMVSGLRAANARHPIVLDGESHSIYGLLATTLDRLLFGSRPFWGEARSGDLRLTWVSADAPGLLRHAPALLRGDPRLAGEPGYQSLARERATLKLDGPFILDGEVYRPTDGRLAIECTAPLRWVML